jgi:rubrerythrin
MQQRYIDEAGRLVALEEFEPNREPWKFAQVLPSIPEDYRCCACGRGFAEHPGATVQCPACGGLYAWFKNPV